MNTINITDKTPIAMLTVGQLKEILANSSKSPKTEVAQEEESATEKNYVYGIAGIQKLFSVSHVTAQRYKETIIADAVNQRGRKIVTDADLAMKLFNESQTK